MPLLGVRCPAPNSTLILVQAKFRSIVKFDFAWRTELFSIFAVPQSCSYGYGATLLRFRVLHDPCPATLQMRDLIFINLHLKI